MRRRRTCHAIWRGWPGESQFYYANGTFRLRKFVRFHRTEKPSARWVSPKANSRSRLNFLNHCPPTCLTRFIVEHSEASFRYLYFLMDLFDGIVHASMTKGFMNALQHIVHLSQQKIELYGLRWITRPPKKLLLIPEDQDDVMLEDELFVFQPGSLYLSCLDPHDELLISDYQEQRIVKIPGLFVELRQLLI